MNNPEVNQKFCFLRPLLQIGSLMVEQSRLTISLGASLVLSYSSQTQEKIDYTIMTTKSLLGKKYKLQLASRFYAVSRHTTLSRRSVQFPRDMVREFCMP